MSKNALSTWDQARDARTFGSIEIVRVIDMTDSRYTASMIYPEAEADEIRLLSRKLGPSHIDPDDLALLLSFHAFIIKTSKLTILLDTCIGNHKVRSEWPAWNNRNGPFLENLDKQGLVPEDIDLVMCTHLHADHIGWNTRLVNGQWVPTFPNAQYLFSKREYKFWKEYYGKNNDPVLYNSHVDSILPVVESGQAVLIDCPYEAATGIHLQPAYGHTPGNMILEVGEGTKIHAVLCGDVMHHPVQLSHPEWSTIFCEDPAMSREARLCLLRRFANTGTFLLPAHFQSPAYGPIERDGTVFRMKNSTGQV